MSDDPTPQWQHDNEEMVAAGYRETDGTVTGGHAGSDASRDRARGQERDGTRAKNMALVLAEVDSWRSRGMTVAEVRLKFPQMHHGTASGVLSNLHKGGKIDRLAQKRGRCHIYVTPSWVLNRETQRQGTRRKPSLREAFHAGMHAREDNYDPGDILSPADREADFISWMIQWTPRP